jgi:hypothetical protein
MTTHVRCGTLFTGDTTPARSDATIGFGADGTIAFVAGTAEAPPVAADDTVLDYSGWHRQVEEHPGWPVPGCRVSAPDDDAPRCRRLHGIFSNPSRATITHE